jgi:hypothetical protein
MLKEFKLIVSSFCFSVLIASSCSDENPADQQIKCVKATVIGKFASAGGGVALSLNKPAFNAEKVRTIFNDQKAYSNVVQAFGLEEQYNAIGTIIYITARAATGEDMANFPPISADGTPAASSIVIINTSNTGCEI